MTTNNKMKLVTPEDLGYFAEKCNDAYVAKRDIEHITKDEIDIMFVPTENAVSSESMLMSKIEKGSNIDFVDDISLAGANTEREGRIVMLKSGDVNFHTKTVAVPSNMNTSTNNWCALYVEVGAKVEFNGSTGGISVNGTTDMNVDGPYCITNFGGEVIINGGEYRGHGSCVYGYEGKTVINGGFFEATPITMSGHKDQPWTLNLLNDAYKNGTASITVYGGTFVNFDPSNPNTDDAPSYVAEGYEVVSEKQTNGDIWYTVVKKG